MKNNKGFSLVELIVVIAIMAILAAVAVVSFSVYIDQARNAADEAYYRNVIKFSQFFATENQVEVNDIRLPEDKVDGAEDIVLVIKNPSTGKLETHDVNSEQWGSKIREIYDAVGDWEWIGNSKFGGNGDGDLGGGSGNQDNNEGSEGCQHLVKNEEIIEPATCKKAGIKRIKCNDCPYTQNETIPMELDHHYLPMNDVQIEGFVISKCEWCQAKQIKNENNLPLVPVG